VESSSVLGVLVVTGFRLVVVDEEWGVLIILELEEEELLLLGAMLAVEVSVGALMMGLQLLWSRQRDEGEEDESSWAREQHYRINGQMFTGKCVIYARTQSLSNPQRLSINPWS
jgi:hypothetical protein